MGDGRWEMGNGSEKGKGKSRQWGVVSCLLSVVCYLLSVLIFLPRIEGLWGLIVEYGMLNK
jgi:hypothetical protein